MHVSITIKTCSVINHVKHAIKCAYEHLIYWLYYKHISATDAGVNYENVDISCSLFFFPQLRSLSEAL